MTPSHINIAKLMLLISFTPMPLTPDIEAVTTNFNELNRNFDLRMSNRDQNNLVK